MRFCRTHWLQLHVELGYLGLGQYIASSHVEAKRTVDLGGFEPLFNAAMEIFATASHRLGEKFDALTDTCPVCWFEADHARQCSDVQTCTFDAESLLSMAAEQQYEDAIRRGLVAIA